MNTRQFIFCLATALTLIAVGSMSASHNPQHWVFYAIAGVLTVLSFSSRKEARVKIWRGNHNNGARQS